MNVFGQMRKCCRAEFLSPKDLLVRAAVISVLFLVVHLAGLREFTSVLNGTVGSVEVGWAKSAFLGAAYILLYLAFVIGVPILVLAAGISLLLQRLFCKPGGNKTETSEQRHETSGAAMPQAKQP